jgi:hypothetical protein
MSTGSLTSISRSLRLSVRRRPNFEASMAYCGSSRSRGIPFITVRKVVRVRCWTLAAAFGSLR